ncbi:LysR family transcriptional regulator [Thiohalobacter sp.]|uniref:LysR family transcriptional regulator n=1 Tax=Thiohalobacter sp. TaxID=2025948 RepID=UPI00261C7CBA|nr:LysR family transcriptional regulator [Thiohalobacter sp.]
MHLTLRQLTLFESVARHLSYTRAAEELHLSQPAVSMQVRQLEEAAGLPLLERMGKRLYLTEAGQEVYDYARRIGQQLQELDEVMASLRGVQRGHLRLSVATTAKSFATRILAAFSRRYEGISYSLDVTNRKTLLGQLENNETDLVIMGQPPKGLDLEGQAFMENPLVVIASPDHPLAQEAGPIPLQRLEQETFVVRERESGTRIAMERFFSERDIRLQTGIETTSNTTIKRAVEAGLGLGIVSLHTLRLELMAGTLVVLEVEEFPIIRHWHLVHRRDKRLPPIARAFQEFLTGPEGRELGSHSLPD